MFLTPAGEALVIVVFPQGSYWAALPLTAGLEFEDELGVESEDSRLLAIENL